MAVDCLGSSMKTLKLNNKQMDVIEAEGAGTITIDGSWILGAEFVRQGTDLFLKGKEGQETLIVDYFNFETMSDLYTENGAVISGELAGKLAGPIAPMQFAQSSGNVEVAQASAKSIGQIENIDGTATATRTDGKQITLKAGSKIFSGDILETGPEGVIGILLEDDSVLSLDSNGRMVMDDVTFDQTSQEGNASINVVQGVFSFVSGQIAKTGPDSMVLKTPVATIGIRGTKLVGTAAAEGEKNTISLLPDADGSVGELSVATEAGTVFLTEPGATTEVTSSFAPPEPPVILPIRTITEKYSTALKSLPDQPLPRDAEGNRPSRQGEEKEDPAPTSKEEKPTVAEPNETNEPPGIPQKNNIIAPKREPKEEKKAPIKNYEVPREPEEEEVPPTGDFGKISSEETILITGQMERVIISVTNHSAAQLIINKGAGLETFGSGSPFEQNNNPFDNFEGPFGDAEPFGEIKLFSDDFFIFQHDNSQENNSDNFLGISNIETESTIDPNLNSLIGNLETQKLAVLNSNETVPYVSQNSLFDEINEFTESQEEISSQPSVALISQDNNLSIEDFAIEEPSFSDTSNDQSAVLLDDAPFII